MDLKIKEKKVQYCVPMLNGEVVVIAMDKIIISDNNAKITLRMYCESDEKQTKGSIFGQDNYLNVNSEGVNIFSTEFLALIKTAFKAKYNLTNQDFV